MTLFTCTQTWFLAQIETQMRPADETSKAHIYRLVCMTQFIFICLYSLSISLSLCLYFSHGWVFFSSEEERIGVWHHLLCEKYWGNFYFFSQRMESNSKAIGTIGCLLWQTYASGRGHSQLLHRCLHFCRPNLVLLSSRLCPHFLLLRSQPSDLYN